jgi:glucarate dehydratase
LRGEDWEYQVPDRVPHFGFEIAVWDVMARLAGLPLFQLFGGAWRTEIPMGFWIGRMSPSDAERQAGRAVEMGFQSLKMKAFPEDPLAEVVGAIHSGAGFSMPIVIDPNRKFQRLGDALRVDRALREFQGISYEDPFPYHPVEWQEFRRATGRPLYWHATKSALRADPIRAGMEGTCDGLNISPFSAKEILQDAENASRFNLLHWQGSGLDLGVLDAFLLHTSAASRTAALPGDAIGHLLRENDLIEESLTVTNGAIPVPTKPGLGVTLDRDALNHFTQSHWEVFL